MTIVEYNFKIAYTGVTMRYYFDNTLPIKTFIQNIINHVFVDFDIRNDLTVEIVEAGLNTNEYESEMAPALESSDISFKNFYINRSPDDLSFYIRIKTPNNNVLRVLEQMQRVN